MFKVKETVFDGEKIIHQSEQEWSEKARFLSELKKLPQISNFTVCELRNSNRAEFTVDGLKRIIEIEAPALIGESKGA